MMLPSQQIIVFDIIHYADYDFVAKSKLFTFSTTIQNCCHMRIRSMLETDSET